MRLEFPPQAAVPCSGAVPAAVDRPRAERADPAIRLCAARLEQNATVQPRPFVSVGQSLLQGNANAGRREDPANRCGTQSYLQSCSSRSRVRSARTEVLRVTRF